MSNEDFITGGCTEYNVTIMIGEDMDANGVENK